MRIKTLVLPAVVALSALAFAVGRLATAQQAADAPPTGDAETQLPPGWTMADMMAYMQASTPGEIHQEMMKGAGEWDGECTLWMAPGTDPVVSPCTSTATPMMGGRFLQIDMDGEMPGMGPYKGFGIYGFDNVSQKFVSIWLDNHGTGIMNGTGSMSDDGTKLTIDYTFNCPINKKSVKAEEVMTFHGDDSYTLEMSGPDPKTGEVYKMMSIKFTRK